MINRYFLRLASVAAGIFMACLIAGLFIIFLAGRSARKAIGNFKPVMAELSDGIYQGNFTYLGGVISAQVSFEVRQGKLGIVKFDKLYGTRSLGAAQRVYAAIDDQRDLDFDGVSGATVTSNLARAAIKNAIDRGPRE